MSKGVSINVREKRSLLLRLARRRRCASPPSLHRQARSHGLPKEDAAGGQRKKKPAGPDATLAQAAAAFWRAYPQTKNWKQVLEELLGVTGPTTRTSELSAFHLECLCADWKTRTAQNTYANYCCLLRQFVRWLELHNLARPGLHNASHKPRRTGPRTTIVSYQQREALLNVAPPHLRLFIYLAADLGMRFRAALSITLRHYDQEHQTISFTTKNLTDQTLPVPPDLREFLSTIHPPPTLDTPLVAYLAGSARPYRRTVHSMNEKPITQEVIRRSWRAALAEAGLPPNLRPHDLRRGAAERIWQATKDLRLAQALLGHKSIATTARYLQQKVDTETLRPVLEAINPQKKGRKPLMALPDDYAPIEGPIAPTHPDECSCCSERFDRPLPTVTLEDGATVRFCSDPCQQEYMRTLELAAQAATDAAKPVRCPHCAQLHQTRIYVHDLGGDAVYFCSPFCYRRYTGHRSHWRPRPELPPRGGVQ